MSSLNMEYARLWVGSKGFRYAVNNMDSSYNIGEVLRQVLENTEEYKWEDRDCERKGFPVICLFVWDSTPNGHRYWSKLDRY